MYGKCKQEATGSYKELRNADASNKEQGEARQTYASFTQATESTATCLPETDGWPPVLRRLQEMSP